MILQRENERGAVLVAALLVLALLSLMGAGSLLNSTIDTKVVSNQKNNRHAFYAAEAAVSIGVDDIMDEFRDTDTTTDWVYIADSTTVVPVGGTEHPITAAVYPEYDLSYSVSNLLEDSDGNPLADGDVPERVVFNTYENGDSVMNYVYRYLVTGVADAKDKERHGSEALTERLYVIERPLSQYLAFYDGDLNIHPANMNSGDTWGRVHANGSVYFSPGANFTLGLLDDTNPFNPVEVSTAVTATGDIMLGEQLQENNAVSAGASATVNVEISTGVDIAIPNDITPATRGPIEELFRVSGVADLRVRSSVDPLRLFPDPGDNTVGNAALDRDGYYEYAAENPADFPGVGWVDGMTILVDGGSLEIMLYPFNDTTAYNVTNDIRDYTLNGNPMDLGDPPDPSFPSGSVTPAWTVDATTQANGISSSTLAPGTIVYCPESQPNMDYAIPAASPPELEDPSRYPTSAATDANINRWYPSVLEVLDGREGQRVEFTVIDLQRLQLWYRDYVALNNGFGDSEHSNANQRQLLIYASRPDPGGSTIQALKLIGSRAGRLRNFGPGSTIDGTQRQLSQTLVTTTTVATDLPVYIEGDFNQNSSGLGIAADSVTLLSNGWARGNNNLFNVLLTNGGPIAFDVTNHIATPTDYNAAFFVGRYNYLLGGGSGDVEGVFELPRLMEDWAGVDLYIRGSLTSPWFAVRTDSEFVDNGTVFTTPNYNIAWDIGYNNAFNNPPHAPRIFTVERESWQDQ